MTASPGLLAADLLVMQRLHWIDARGAEGW